MKYLFIKLLFRRSFLAISFIFAFLFLLTLNQNCSRSGFNTIASTAEPSSPNLHSLRSIQGRLSKFVMENDQGSSLSYRLIAEESGLSYAINESGPVNLESYLDHHVEIKADFSKNSFSSISKITSLSGNPITHIDSLNLVSSSGKSILMVGVNYKDSNPELVKILNSHGLTNLVFGPAGLNSFMNSMTRSDQSYFDPGKSRSIIVNIEKIPHEIFSGSCQGSGQAHLRNEVIAELSKMGITISDFDHNVFIHNLKDPICGAAIGQVNGGNIDIFSFYSFDPTSDVLAHEFGHNLGLMHSGITDQYAQDNSLDISGGFGQINKEYGDFSSAMAGGGSHLFQYSGIHLQRLGFLSDHEVLNVEDFANSNRSIRLATIEAPHVREGDVRIIELGNNFSLTFRGPLYNQNSKSPFSLDKNVFLIHRKILQNDSFSRTELDRVIEVDTRTSEDLIDLSRYYPFLRAKIISSPPSEKSVKTIQFFAQPSQSYRSCKIDQTEVAHGHSADFHVWNDYRCDLSAPRLCNDGWLNGPSQNSYAKCSTPTQASQTYAWSTSSWSNLCTASPTWILGDWSNCSAACGPGTQTRTLTCSGTQGTRTRGVQCLRNDGVVSPDSNCPGQKPATVQNCNSTCSSSAQPETVRSCKIQECQTVENPSPQNDLAWATIPNSTIVVEKGQNDGSIPVVFNIKGGFSPYTFSFDGITDSRLAASWTDSTDKVLVTYNTTATLKLGTMHPTAIKNLLVVVRDSRGNQIKGTFSFIVKDPMADQAVYVFVSSSSTGSCILKDQPCPDAFDARTAICSSIGSPVIVRSKQIEDPTLLAKNCGDGFEKVGKFCAGITSVYVCSRK